MTVLDLLQQRAPRAPRSYLRQLLRRGKVLRQGAAAGDQNVLAAGDRLLLPASRRLAELLLPADIADLRILLETGEALVVYKPPGLAVHRSAGHADNLADRVQTLMRERGEPFRTDPVHRLDAATSGPVLFGKGRRAAGIFGRLFQERQVEKIYLAVTAGRMTAAAGRLDSPVPAKGQWKEAAADLRLLGARDQFSLVQVRLISGRTHQIRRQLSDAGHPIAGDRRYGGPAISGLNRLYLHCLRLAWPDPETGLRVEVESPLPEDLNTVLQQLFPQAGEIG